MKARSVPGRLLLLAARTSPLALRVLSRLLDSKEFAAYDRGRWEREYAAGGWDWLRGSHEAIHQHVIACYCKHLHPCPSILDVGCGEGVLNELLRHGGYASYTGIDIASGAVAKAGRLADHRTRFLVADADRFAPDLRFDIVVFNETLYYFPDPTATLRRVGGLLHPGGLIVVSMAQGGVRDRLLKLRIWRDAARDHAVEDEISLGDAGAWTRTIKVLRPRLSGERPPPGLAAERTKAGGGSCLP